MEKITVMGEALLRLYTGQPLEQAEQFQVTCGGTGLETACTIARLGGRCSLLACIGEDPFGDRILEWLTRHGVDTDQMQHTGRAATTLCFVREGMQAYYPAPGADRMLSAAALREERLGESCILHVSSMDLGEEPCRFAHQRAIRTIRQQGGCISFAPCYHPALWDSSAAWQAAMRSFLPFADLITVGQESLALLTGCPDAAGAHRLLLEGNCKLLCYLSGQGVRLTNGRSTAVVPVDQPVPEPAAAGALLYALAQDWIPGKGLSGLSHGELYRLAEFIVLYALPPALG
ncbi:carbohydrate kinase family protein [Ruminococcus champanellensis]|uniref:Sugar kinases, ribokinase family n=1 Tax=Ruminococcus champanellensis (strain DSM 18848 / JCM 17042 / KCTC 15320 / 18P13) TaxID=213810 RepID=D4L9U3_RUMC1|nr:PfkB family carbohydrate kinase [Ruminococcus champanellensis]CBL16388.1 Sugar kinases, ribokinase family [Ruminococcus champanellensis 18P13 = JCM 17042]